MTLLAKQWFALGIVVVVSLAVTADSRSLSKRIDPVYGKTKRAPKPMVMPSCH
jgi:hypothetical protein